MQQPSALLLLAVLCCEDMLLLYCSSLDLGLQVPSWYAVSGNVTPCNGSTLLHQAE